VNDPYAVSASYSFEKMEDQQGGKLGLTCDIPRMNSKNAQ
jgi:hypothetical protein